MTDKIIELSRGVVTAPAYGESNRWSGVDQVNVLKVTADTCANVETRRCCEGVFGRLPDAGVGGFPCDVGRDGIGVPLPGLTTGSMRRLPVPGAPSWWSWRRNTHHSVVVRCEEENST